MQIYSKTHKLADRKYHYDITVDNGNLKISEDLKAKIDKGQIVQLFVVTNGGITYQSTQSFIFNITP